jgi:hypothetical protein
MPSIKNQIASLTCEPKTELRMTWDSGPGQKEINLAFRHGTIDQQANLMKELIDLWRNSKRSAEAKEFFGEFYEKFNNDGRLIYTLTADGKQFRIWYGLPACMRKNHVDSCGRGLLATIGGDSVVVDRLAREIFPMLFESSTQYQMKIKVPNGTTLFMFYEY